MSLGLETSPDVVFSLGLGLALRPISLNLEMLNLEHKPAMHVPFLLPK